MEQRKHSRAVGTEDPRENQPTGGNVRHDSHVRWLFKFERQTTIRQSSYPLTSTHERNNFIVLVFTQCRLARETKIRQSESQLQEELEHENFRNFVLHSYRVATIKSYKTSRLASSRKFNNALLEINPGNPYLFRDEREEKTGDPRENPPTSSIVRHDSRTRKSWSDPVGNCLGGRRDPGVCLVRRLEGPVRFQEVDDPDLTRCTLVFQSRSTRVAMHSHTTRVYATSPVMLSSLIDLAHKEIKTIFNRIAYTPDLPWRSTLVRRRFDVRNVLGSNPRGVVKRENPEKTRRPTASSGTIPKCENPVTRPGIEPGSPWLEASGSILDGIAPGFSQVAIVPDDAASRRVFSGIGIARHDCHLRKSRSDSARDGTQYALLGLIERDRERSPTNCNLRVRRTIKLCVARRPPTTFRGRLSRKDPRWLIDGCERASAVFNDSGRSLNRGNDRRDSELSSRPTYTIKSRSGRLRTRERVLKVAQARGPLSPGDLLTRPISCFHMDAHDKTARDKDDSTRRSRRATQGMVPCLPFSSRAVYTSRQISASLRYVTNEAWDTSDRPPGVSLFAISSHSGPRWRAVSLLASHQGDPGSIPGRVTPDFRMWESFRTMPLIGGSSRGSPVSSAPPFRDCSIPTSITLICSQGLDFLNQTFKKSPQE
ncbi:hypothetical protein PR048_021265 [Dryococelus australis]|uniref:Uncharacterized protein n=1 Tax=Dryococelus australis TaxID=614101 RepID=A0ABQ9GXU9_9NEOP|nr:hypothetical protein PR048_021265 [Dryococelus australis]